MSLKTCVLVLLAALPCLPTSPAHADLTDTVTWARSEGCPRSVHAPFHGSAELDLAARHLANGDSLRAALRSVGYVAETSAAIYLSGAPTDRQLRFLLTGQYCTTVTDPKLTEFGVQRRGGNAWVVLASRLPLPATGDARVIGRQILELVNAARSGGRRCGAKAYPPTAPLLPSASLERAALAHSRDMAASGQFEHRGSDGSSPSTRVERAGYGGYSLVGENIAAGALTPAEVADGWLESPAHCENIMDPRFKEIGVGFAVNPSSAALVYWTQDFAVARRPRAGRPAGS